MVERKPISLDDIFSNDAARVAGFTDEFWFDAYNRWLEAIRNDPQGGFVAYESEHTFRMSYRHGDVDVLVRIEPEGREHPSLRFTAFPAENTPSPRPINRWYQYDETRATLGEAALLDVNNRW